MSDGERPEWAARLEAEREARGWNKREMARRLLRSAGHEHGSVNSLTRQIYGWEDGTHFPRDWATAYAVAFDLDEADLFGESDSELGPAGPGQGYTLLRRRIDEALAVGAMAEASLQDWDLTVAGYGDTARDRPAGLVLSDLVTDLDDLHRALDRHRSASALRQLTRVTAQMSGLMCLILIKLDDRVAFRRWARTARTAANEAGDPQTHSWVLAQEAYGHYYAGDFTEAIRVAQGAQRIAGPCVGPVLAAALEARAHAALGPGRAEQTRAALVRAEDLLGNLPAEAVNTSAFGYNEAQLRFHEGSALTHLGDTAAAWRAQQRALDLCPPDNFMDRTLTRLDRAICLARDGDITGALEYATEALAPLTEQQRQGIIVLRGLDVLTEVTGRQRSVAAAQDLREMLSSPLTTAREVERP